LCCGRCKIDGAVNVDIHDLPEVDIIADIENLPDDLKKQEFDVVLIDPPYSEQDANRYKVPRLVNARKVMVQAKLALKNGGYLLWLDEKYPSYRRNDWQLVGLISVVTGFERRVRVLSIFKKPTISDSTTGEDKIN
jgi:tRNA G10  N-methylase Trm11